MGSFLGVILCSLLTLSTSKVSVVIIIESSLSTTLHETLGLTPGVKDAEWYKDVQWVTDNIINERPDVMFSVFPVPSLRTFTAKEFKLIKGEISAVITVSRCGLYMHESVPHLSLSYDDCIWNYRGTNNQTTIISTLEAYESSRRVLCMSGFILKWLREQMLHTVGRYKWLLKTTNQEQRSIADDQCNRLDIIPRRSSTREYNNGRRVLNGKHLVITTIHRPPFTVIDFDENDQVLSYHGQAYDVLDTLKENLNFSYTLVPPYDGNWGKKMKNGTWNGMVGMVYRKEVDMGATGFSTIYPRSDVVEFTTPFFSEYCTILTPPPRPQDKTTAMIRPFGVYVWLCLLASLLVVSPLLWFLNQMEYKLRLSTNKVTETPSRDVQNYFWFTFGGLVLKNGVIPMIGSAQILVATWWFVVITMTFAYTGSLVAFLTVPKLIPLVESLEELGNQKQLKWVVRKSTSLDNLFTNADSGIYAIIGAELKKNPDWLLPSNSKGIEAVLTGEYAFVKEKSYLEFGMAADVRRTGKCRMHLVKKEFFPASKGFILPRQSPFMSIFNYEIMRMVQTGLTVQWKRKNWPPPNQCSTSSLLDEASLSRALDLTDIYGNFLILSIGMAAALLTLVLEVIVKKAMPKNPDRHTLENIKVGYTAPQFIH